MKKVQVFLGLLLLVGLAGAAAPINLCNYVSPETNLSDLKLSMSYRYFDDGATAGVETSGGRVALDFGQLYDSPNIGFTLAGSGEILLTRLAPSAGLGEASGTFRYYLTEDAPLFGFGGLETSIATGQPQPGVSVRAGVGYGRFSDVTPLAKAVTMEKELLKVEAISQPLGDGTLMAIARAIGRRIEFASVKDLAAEVVSLIQAGSGVTLAPRQVLMVEDVVIATGDSRNCGWAVQAGVGYELVDAYAGARDLLLTASADAALAPDPASQLLFRASFSGPFQIMDENTLTLRTSYDRALSETSTLLLAYSLQRVQPLDHAVSTSHAATLTLGFGIGGADVGLQVSLSKAPTSPAWTIDVSISAAMSLL